jgi:hypothetical protein
MSDVRRTIGCLSSLWIVDLVAAANGSAVHGGTSHDPRVAMFFAGLFIIVLALFFFIPGQQQGRLVDRR